MNQESKSNGELTVFLTGVLFPSAALISNSSDMSCSGGFERKIINDRMIFELMLEEMRKMVLCVLRVSLE